MSSLHTLELLTQKKAKAISTVRKTLSPIYKRGIEEIGKILPITLGPVGELRRKITAGALT